MAVRLIVLSLLACLSWRQQAVFASDEALWRHAVEQAPQLTRPAINLGAVYRAQGRRELAIAWLERAGGLSETDPRRAEFRREIARQLQWLAAFGHPVCDPPSASRYCWP